MSEFKFACPVCGQHITADSKSSGSKLECPTCYRKIVVPQAPAAGDSKFILSAAQADKPRPPSSTTDLGPMEAPPKKSWLPAVAAVVALLCVAAGGVFLLRGKIFKHPAEQASDSEETSSKDGGKKHPRVTHPIPTNTAWTLAFTNAVVPESAAVGSIHGSGFLCERSTLQGGVLNLRQGKNWPPDLGVTINMAARQGEDLANKTVEVGPERPPPVPKITMRWKDENDKAQTRNIPDGYALRVAFGPAENNRITGKIYLGLPDDEKSFVAGTFDAEIRKVTPPKPKSPKPAKPAGK